MNITDDYKEPLFNRNVDMVNNYRTKSILCVPIFDQFDKVIGAC